jgi:hypothetical protein
MEAISGSVWVASGKEINIGKERYLKIASTVFQSLADTDVTGSPS